MIFGSVARDEAGSQSDVDILVEVDSTIGLDFATLADGPLGGPDRTQGESGVAAGYPAAVVDAD